MIQMLKSWLKGRHAAPAEGGPGLQQQQRILELVRAGAAILYRDGRLSPDHVARVAEILTNRFIGEKPELELERERINLIMTGGLCAFIYEWQATERDQNWVKCVIAEARSSSGGD